MGWGGSPKLLSVLPLGVLQGSHSDVGGKGPHASSRSQERSTILKYSRAFCSSNKICPMRNYLTRAYLPGFCQGLPSLYLPEGKYSTPVIGPQIAFPPHTLPQRDEKPAFHSSFYSVHHVRRSTKSYKAYYKAENTV